jgi:Leucine-rich repeat (LRR) protein
VTNDSYLSPSLKLPSRLSTLSLSGNLISNIDLNNNTALTTSSLSSNQITNIDISNNSELIYLNLEENQLTQETRDYLAALVIDNISY